MGEGGGEGEGGIINEEIDWEVYVRKVFALPSETFYKSSRVPEFVSCRGFLSLFHVEVLCTAIQ